MDKNAIRKYAVWARRELISRVSQKALQYGISDKEIVPATATSVNGVVLAAEEMKQRAALIEQINSKGYEQVMEEVAYTWFNRFIALRFMEVNGYLPSRVRVFTDEDNSFNPQILTEAISLELDGLDMEKVYALKDANDNEGLFKYLIIVQCNALSPILPRMFQRLSDYTELLFPDNLLREGSAIEQMVTMIPEADWKDAVQIIGWLYQFYNIEPKAAVFAKPKGTKILKEEVPAATQLFTPDWIVRYMVENSLGRLWVEGHPGDSLKGQWKYYLDEAVQEPDVQMQLATIRKEYAAMAPEQIKCIDPCAGSGHVLVYMFDVLVQIYEDYGYSAREAVRGIIENNLYGLDIDERAAQLAYFAVMMKARQYDRRFFARKDENGNPDVPQPHVYTIVESNGMDAFALDYFINGDAALKKAMDSIIKEMQDAKEYGSILKITPIDFSKLYTRLDEVRDDIDLSKEIVLNCILPLIQVAEVLAQKYQVVVTNPPYMTPTPVQKPFVEKEYPDSKADLFAIFIERCRYFAEERAYFSLITQQSWMFLSSFEKLRVKLRSNDMIGMVHLGARAFDEIGGEVVQPTAFICRNSLVNGYKATYFKLDAYGSQDEKEHAYLIKQNRYVFENGKFSELPGGIYSYWATDGVIKAFNSAKALEDSAAPKRGMCTCGNELFYRNWYEIPFGDFCFPRRSSIHEGWVPLNKGGEYRKWYGNLYEVVDWKNNAQRLRNYPTAQIKNEDFYFLPAITWSSIASKRLSFRYTPDGFIFDQASNGVFPPADSYYYYLALLNSKAATNILSVINPSFNVLVGDIAKIPVVVSNEKIDLINALVKELISLSKVEWDSFETSWDFQCHPLIAAIPKGGAWFEIGNIYLSECYQLWENECSERFACLKANEEELNRTFIEIYGLQDELTPDVEDKDVTVRLADQKRDIKSLISYAIGCMFGRYSLNVPGLAYAGGSFDEVYQKDVLGDGQGNAITVGGVKIGVSNSYTRVKVGDGWVDCTIPVDADNIIPICDDEYFADDIVSRFIRFIETVYGKDTLQENLRFIADALGGSGQPKDIIRNYFLNDFYTDHLKMYQKRPIYWLFDSGKKGGFRALVYMHRYQPDTIARMRTDYVHEQQARYRTAIADLEQRMASSATSERVKLSKRLKKLQEQAAEIQGYEEKIHHLADQYIAIDLDDGVKKNYEIFKDVLAKIK